MNGFNQEMADPRASARVNTHCRQKAQGTSWGGGGDSDFCAGPRMVTGDPRQFKAPMASGAVLARAAGQELEPYCEPRRPPPYPGADATGPMGKPRWQTLPKQR